MIHNHGHHDPWIVEGSEGHEQGMMAEVFSHLAFLVLLPGRQAVNLRGAGLPAMT